MIIIENFNQVTAQIETERGISKEVLVQAVEQALVSACRKKMREEVILEADLNPETGEARIYQLKTIVASVEDVSTQILLKDAQEIDKAVQLDETMRFDVTPSDFGRLAAQTAKQVIVQRIREAEKQVIFKEFKDKVGKIVIGTVQRVENQNYLVNLGRGESVLGYRDQTPGERYLPKEKIKVYITELDKNAKGSFIQISRTHPGFLRELLVIEIPEIQDGIIEIMSVSRKPGERAKVAVKSSNPAVSAVGTCVGHMGARIQSVTKELGNEKIDVLEWHEDPKLFIASALKPAKVVDVIITDSAAKAATVIVPSDQLSLTIGKGGVNVQLAVRLTGWRLDSVSEDNYKGNRSPASPGLSIVERIQLEKQRQEAIVKATYIEDDGVDEPVKVSDLAKLLDMKTKDLVLKAQEMGLDSVKNIRSVVEPDVALALRRALT